MRQPVQQLIQLYQNNLFTAAFNICQNQMDAEDAVQETFVQYYTSRKEFENEQHIRAWLLRVVINKAKNMNRTFWKKNKLKIIIPALIVLALAAAFIFGDRNMPQPKAPAEQPTAAVPVETPEPVAAAADVPAAEHPHAWWQFWKKG